MKTKLDMINGKLSKSIIVFSVPIILTSVLQLLFNACDLVVVGKFAGDHALAAVGSTGSLTHLIVNGFLGISVGANVIAAQFFGMKNEENIEKTIHTSIALGLIFGIFLAIAGTILAKPCLKYMNTPDEIIDLSVLYMKIYFLGMPAMLTYNFGAAILRAQGNTKTPLLYLSIAGVINVILNLILVIVFDLSVAGVAVATSASHIISCVLVLKYLIKNNGLKLRKLKMERILVKKIFYIGIPSGINSIVFSFANMQIQANANSFGAAAVAGCSAAGNIDGFVYVSMNALSQAATSFTGQNIGAGKKERVPKIAKWCIIYVLIIGGLVSSLTMIFGEQLLGLYINGTEAVTYGMIRLKAIIILYVFCGCMEVYQGVARGMGYSVIPAVISLLGACGFRLLWIATVFQKYRTLFVLYFSQPVSWIITLAAQYTYYLIIKKRENIK